MSRQEVTNSVLRFLKDEDGATAIEYGLLAALISIVIAAGAKLVGDELTITFTTIKDALVAANPTPP